MESSEIILLHQLDTLVGQENCGSHLHNLRELDLQTVSVHSEGVGPTERGGRRTE